MVPLFNAGWITCPDKLGAAGAEKQQLRLGHHGRRLLAVLEDVTDLFAHFCTTRFAGDEHLITLLPQAGYQPFDVRGLSAAFPALKSNEFAFFSHFSERFSRMIVPRSRGGQDLAPSLLFLK